MVMQASKTWAKVNGHEQDKYFITAVKLNKIPCKYANLALHICRVARVCFVSTGLKGYSARALTLQHNTSSLAAFTSSTRPTGVM
jgi:hypothetical protein